MEYIKTDSLTDRQIAGIRQLVDTCHIHDGSRLSFPYEGQGYFYLALKEQDAPCPPFLISALSLTFIQEDLCECCAFTRPGYRRCGYFTELLDEALADLSEIQQEKTESRENLEEILFYFAADQACPDTKAALKKLGAEYWYSDFLMEFPLDVYTATTKPGVTLSWIPCSGTLEGLDGTSDVGGMQCSYHLPDATKIGSSILSPYRTNAVYFFGFQLEEQFRGLGLGRKALLSTLNFLKGRQVGAVFLQVSEQNEAAVSLYKKTGFRVVETLSYYFY